MKKLQLALLAAGLVIAGRAQATLYDITFTQTGESDQYGSAVPPSITDAIGTLNVVGGFAVSGTLDVLSGPDAGNYILVPGSGSDGVFVYDNVVLTGGGPFLDSTAGLLWSATGGPGASLANPEMNMWYNAASQYSQPAGSYSLWGAPPSYNPEAYGIATLTAVPEPMTVLSGVLLLLPLGVSTLRILRKSRMA